MSAQRSAFEILTNICSSLEGTMAPLVLSQNE